MSGLWTRPSVPTIKLTLTLLLRLEKVKRGSGVVRGCGGRVFSQTERIRGTATNWAARISCLEIWGSLCSKVADRICGGKVVTASIATGIARSRKLETMRPGGGSKVVLSILRLFRQRPANP